MQHYSRDEAATTTTVSSTDETTVNRITVHPGSTVRDLVSRSLRDLGFPDQSKQKDQQTAAVSATTAATSGNSQQQVTLYGVGKAVGKTISIAEIVKRRALPDTLHQYTSIENVTKIERWRPKSDAPDAGSVKGLNDIEVERMVPAVSIVLSRQPLHDPASTTVVGYQMSAL
ncbi:hypothetical protein GQ42DRAFT_176836 [Ramicandelaber brevisporus]|nr:hypothetical protein GQ42DRAFT_176836 [Ramicandelaber brevisporus]